VSALFDPVVGGAMAAAIGRAPAVAAAFTNLTAAVDEYHAYWQSHPSYGGVPPLSVVVSLGNTVLFGAHRGYRNATNASSGAPNMDTVYAVGSNTKTFTTLAFYREMQQGSVGLVDPVSRHLPAFDIGNPYSQGKVTLAALATQSSGLPRAPTCGNIGPCGNDVLLTSYRYQDALFPPLTGGDYSNLGIALLGHAVMAAAANATGVNATYEQYLATHVLGPLNMTRSGFYPTLAEGTSEAVPGTWPSGVTTADIDVNLAVPTEYDLELHRFVPVPRDLWGFRWTNPAGGLLASPSDMIKYLQWALSSGTSNYTDGGSGIAASTVLSWLGPGFDLPDGLSGYGAGAWERAYMQGTWVVTKAGLAAGAATDTALVPEIGLSVATFFGQNGAGTADGILALALEQLIPAIKTELLRLPCDAPFAAADAATLTGTWQAGAATFGFSALPDDPSRCSLYGVFSEVYSTPRSLIVTPAPTSATVDPGALFALINSSFGGGFTAGVGSAQVVFAFEYSPNLADPTTQPLGASCYLEDAIGARGVGYVVKTSAAPALMWLPNMNGAMLFGKQ
jgi:CubicO group peptidase (beta-lactamase class C family)